jgi:glycosyltransferase involved in cell wall biosynthesis
MKVLIVLPPNQPRIGGNVTYSTRIKKGLAPRGIHVEIKSLDQAVMEDYKQADIVHVYNAFRTGRFVLPIVKDLKKPMILTITGTDINEYMTKEETRKETYAVVEYASRIIQLTHSSRDELKSLVPSAAEKSQVVNLGVDLPKPSGKTRKDFGLAEDDFVFLLPAGIRPVKNPLAAYGPLGKLHERYPFLKFVVAGPEMDKELSAEFVKKMNEAEWGIYLGEVDHEYMPDLLLAADVILNTSKSEGLSHALLEGMYLGKPALASRVPGNVDLIRDGKTGYLFATEEEFLEKAAWLMEDSSLRDELARAGQEWVKKNYSVEQEIQSFCQIYRKVLSPDYSIKCE